MIRSVVLGSGAAKPRNVVTNDDLAKKVDTSDEWIQQRTGIEQRYIADEDETTASLGEAAARAALADANLTVDDIDMIILATSTPNNTFPATAVNIQNRLGMKHGAAFDMQAVCSGFVYAVTTADSFIKAGQAKRMDSMLGALEKDTGFRVKVLCQNYPNTPGLAIRDYWSLGKDDQMDDKYVVLVVDQFGGRGNSLNFNVGDVSSSRKWRGRRIEARRFACFV